MFSVTSITAILIQISSQWSRNYKSSSLLPSDKCSSSGRCYIVVNDHFPVFVPDVQCTF